MRHKEREWLLGTDSNEINDKAVYAEEASRLRPVDFAVITKITKVTTFGS
jgi:hypothetical protein